MQYHIPSLSKLVELHNEARHDTWFSKIPDLKPDSGLAIFASSWAETMSKRKRLKHSNIRDILTLGFKSAGENIAYGQKDEEAVMKTWLKSYGHRKNIMNKSFTHIGCGFSYSDDDILYWCVCFGKR